MLAFAGDYFSCCSNILWSFITNQYAFVYQYRADCLLCVHVKHNSEICGQISNRFCGSVYAVGRELSVQLLKVIRVTVYLLDCWWDSWKNSEGSLVKFSGPIDIWTRKWLVHCGTDWVSEKSTEKRKKQINHLVRFLSCATRCF